MDRFLQWYLDSFKKQGASTLNALSYMNKHPAEWGNNSWTHYAMPPYDDVLPDMTKAWMEEAGKDVGRFFDPTKWYSGR